MASAERAKAGSVTGMVVGSGALFGRFEIWRECRISNLKVGHFREVGRRAELERERCNGAAKCSCTHKRVMNMKGLRWLPHIDTKSGGISFIDVKCNQ